MAALTPYTYIQCPCSDQVDSESDADSQPEAVGDDERTFDPRALRSNYSLFPLEYLMYCEDCQQIRCPRCVSEEIVTYYCPNCLMEVPSTTLRSEGNRYDQPFCPGASPVGYVGLIPCLLDAPEAVTNAPIA